MFVPKYLVNCNAYQPSFQFPLCFSYEDVAEKDDISRTVKKVVEEVNIFKKNQSLSYTCLSKSSTIFFVYLSHPYGVPSHNA